MRYNVEHKQADILSDHERIQFQGGYNIIEKEISSPSYCSSCRCIFNRLRRIFFLRQL